MMDAAAERERLAVLHNIDTPDANLLLTSDDAHTLSMQAERFAALSAPDLTRGNVAPREGYEPTGAQRSDYEEFVAELFARDD